MEKVHEVNMNDKVAPKGDNMTAVEEVVQPGTIQPATEAAEVTTKTWVVIWMLSLQFGTAFWPVPAINAVSGPIAASLGDPSAANWYVTSFVLAICIAYMTCGTNSDLFGRRNFILVGNVLCFVGNIIASRAQQAQTVIIGMAIMGFGSGNCQLASIALPELMPNKWRHIGIVVTDMFFVIAVVIGPVAARYSVLHSEAWRWLYYAPAISHVFCFAGIYAIYYPPKHPRGVPFRDAVRGMDWVGMFLFIVGGTLTLAGCLLTTTTPASDVRVLAPLITGLAFLVVFGIWENQAEKLNVKYPLCPRHVFTKGKGRDMTAPFLVVFTQTMFYYIINVVWPTQVNVFWGGAADIKTGAVLSLAPNLGLVFGSILLVLFGSRIGRWKWSLTTSVVITVTFGALLALGRPDRKGMMIAFVFINQVAMAWGQYLSVAYTQLGVDHLDLGVSGGLSGVARNGGGVVALTASLTILTNVQARTMTQLVPPAALAAGLPPGSVEALLNALPLGEAALSQVPGATQQVLEAALGAFLQSFVVALRTTALASLSFGGVCIVACLFCKDIDEKMTDKIEAFLENDENADKNRFH